MIMVCSSFAARLRFLFFPSSLPLRWWRSSKHVLIFLKVLFTWPLLYRLLAAFGGVASGAGWAHHKAIADVVQI
jgi:hypothetical protein